MRTQTIYREYEDGVTRLEAMRRLLAASQREAAGWSWRWQIARLWALWGHWRGWWARS